MTEKKQKESIEELIMSRLDDLEQKIHDIEKIIRTQLSYIGKRVDFEVKEETSVIEFQVDSNYFCFNIDDIREIIRIIAITEVPDAPDILEGVINFRGELVPIIDFRHRIGVEKREYELDDNIIIFHVDKGNVGIIVDTVTEVNIFHRDQVEPPVEAPFQKSFIKGMVKRNGQIIMMVDPRLLLSIAEQEEVDNLIQQESQISPDQKTKKANSSPKRSKRKNKK